MEPENRKTESINENEKKENKNVDLFKKYVLQKASTTIIFFQCSLCHIINLLLTKLVQSRLLDIGGVPFLRFYGRRLRSISSHLDVMLGQ